MPNNQQPHRDSEPQPRAWEQQTDETQRQFASFCEYRDLHPLKRSLVKVAQELGVSDTYVERLSSQFHWVSRSTEWDKEQDRSRRDRLEAEIDEMNARHAHLAETVFAKVTEAVTSLDTKKLAPNQIAKLMEVSIKAERLARGESAETVAFEPAGIRADEVHLFLQSEGLIPPPGNSQPDSSNDERLGKWLAGELNEDGDLDEDG